MPQLPAELSGFKNQFPAYCGNRKKKELFPSWLQSCRLSRSVIHFSIRWTFFHRQVAENHAGAIILARTRTLRGVLADLIPCYC